MACSGDDGDDGASPEDSTSVVGNPTGSTGSAPTAQTAATAETGQPATGETGQPTGPGCYQELAAQTGQVEFVDDSVVIESTLAITTSAVPTTPLPSGFDIADYHGAVDPASAVGWWDGWTVRNPAIDGGLPGAAFHPLEAEINAGVLVPSVTNACQFLDLNMADGGTVDIFGVTFPVCIVSDAILTNQTWPNNHVFFLTDVVTVGTGDQQLGGGVPTTNVTLTIQAGTQIYGSPDGSSLVISRGSEIDAQGTDDLPILFAAADGNASGITGNIEDLTGRGEWGGLVLSGFAPTNSGDANGELLTEWTPLDRQRFFGGTSPLDSSGALRYVVIAESGDEIRPTEFMPGLGFEAVGRNTTFDYVQVVGTERDGIAWFGGEPRGKWFVINAADDDSLDFDLGYQGTLQFGIVRLGATNGNRGIESDNNGDNFAAAPRTSPDLANLTFLGNQGRIDSLGVLSREGSRERLFRTVIADDAIAGGSFERGCFDIDDELPAELQWRDIVTDCSAATFAECEADENPPTLPPATGDTGQPGGSCYQGLAVQNGQIDAVDDSVTIESTLAISTSAGPPATPLPPSFDPADYYGAIDPAAVTGWWEGWTVQNPAIDGGFTGPAFHPLQADLSNGTLVPFSGNACTQIDANMRDGGVVDVFGFTFPVCIVDQRITSDQTWPNNHVFFLDGTVTVGDGDAELAGSAPSSFATLTIQPGTQVYASPNATTLVISRGSELRARGTFDLPIVFAGVDGDGINGITGDPTDLTERGRWGGLVLSGFGQTNASNADGEMLTELVSPGEERWFGGNLDTDSSGQLEYLILAETGFEIRQDEEVPGLTFEAAGSDTFVRYVQVLGTEDDCLRTFGGVAGVKYFVCNGPDNDGLDLDLGYRGRLQFGIVRLGSSNGDRAIETDNNGGDFGATPTTAFRLANYTILGNVGKGSTEAAVSREGSSERVFRTVFADDAPVAGAFVTGGIDVDDDVPAGLQWSDIVTDVAAGGIVPCETGELP